MQIPVDTYTLPNGLRVILSEDHATPVVAVNLWYHVGSANEREGRTGFAHLFEHMLFQGSEHVGANEHFELVQRAMDRAADDATTQLEKRVGFLATTGSVAPFIGLMGTVWGVMVSFVNIGAQGSATLVVVAPGIAEALIATIAGLAAAIPAAIGYNHLLGKLREIGHAATQFTSEYLDRRMGARHS